MMSLTRLIRLVAFAMIVILPMGASAAIKVKHKPVKDAKSHTRILLKAKASDSAGGIVEVRAYFRNFSESRFYFIPMPLQDGVYRGVLPAASLGAGRIDYFFYAISSNQQFVRTQQYSINIDDDEDALARMQAKEPTNVDIDVDRVQQIRDMANESGEPSIDRRVDVRNDVPGSAQPNQIPGFSDYIAMSNAAPAAAGAGVAAATPVVASAGAGAGAVLGGIAVAGATGAVAGGSSSDDSSSNSSTPAPTATPATVTPTFRSMVGTWGGGNVTWIITQDNGSSWAGTSTPGGCGDTISIRGSRSGNQIRATYSNPQGGGSLSGVLSNNVTRVDISFMYNSGVCNGERGRNVLRRR